MQWRQHIIEVTNFDEFENVEIQFIDLPDMISETI